METADKVFTRIMETRSLVDQALQRAQNAPYPKSDRSRRIQEIRDAAQEVQASAAEAIRVLEGPARESLEAAQASVQERHQAVQALDRQSQEIQQLVAARKREHQAAIASAAARKASPAEHTELMEEWTKEKTALDLQQAQIATARTQLATEVAELSLRVQQQQVETQRGAALARQQPPSVNLLTADGEMSAVLDRAGLLEKEIYSGATADLQLEVKNRLGEKTVDFSEAESYHKEQSSNTLYAMALSIAISTMITYAMFVDASHLDLEDSASVASTVVTIMHLVVGRIAVLFFLAWIVRYLSILHRVHTAQAVVYRDRKAALGVAEVLLDATPGLEQKREILRALTTAYLSFDRHTFLGATPMPESRPADRTLEDQLDQLKQVVKTVEPLLTAVGKITRG